MDCFIHQSPGRLRVRIADLKGNSEKMGRLANVLRVMNGVELVTVRRITGSLVIYYDDRRVLPSALLEQLAAYDLLPRNVVGFPRPIPSRPLYPQGAPVARAAASFKVSPDTQKILWAAGKVILGLIIERAVDKKTRMILSALL